MTASTAQASPVADPFADPAELLSTVALVAPEPILVKDLAGRYRFANAAAADVMGCDVASIVGHTDADLYDPAYAEIQAGLDARVVAEGVKVHGEVEAEIRGRRHTFVLCKGPYRDRSGAVIGIVCVKRDVTETRSLETQLRHAQRLEAVGRLAGSVAHDFNNVLAGIMGFAELLQDSFAKADPRRDDAIEIVRAAERGRTVLRQLLTFSRRDEQRCSLVNVDTLVDRLVPLLEQIAGRTSTIERTGAANGTVFVDAGLLEQVVVNLVTNARDALRTRFGADAGPPIRIATGRCELHEVLICRSGSVPPGRYLTIAVSDDGVGIDDEALARLFEPFFTTKSPGAGTGLGLSTAYGIVAQAGGAIDVASTLAHGATFTIYLPESLGSR